MGVRNSRPKADVGFPRDPVRVHYLVGAFRCLRVWMGTRLFSLIHHLFTWMRTRLLSLNPKLPVDDPLAQEYKAVLQLIDSLETIPENEVACRYIKGKFREMEPLLQSLRDKAATHPDRLEPLKADFHLRACYWVFLTRLISGPTDALQPISWYDHPYEDAQVDLKQHAQLPGGAEAVQAYESWVEEQEKRGYVGQAAKDRILARRAQLADD
jgi:hypothetical protein